MSRIRATVLTEHFQMKEKQMLRGAMMDLEFEPGHHSCDPNPSTASGLGCTSPARRQGGFSQASGRCANPAITRGSTHRLEGAEPPPA